MIVPTIVVVRVVTKPEYDAPISRWADSYRRFRPAIPHEVVVIDRYADHRDDLLDDIATRYVRYDESGWDCGSWQFAGKNIESELLVCFNSNTRIAGEGWLSRIVNSVNTYGFGLYGPLSSNEINPHIRTPCMIFQPQIINLYPAKVDSRDDTYRFESMGFGHCDNFTMWCNKSGFNTRLITWDGCYDMSEWRQPDNIFRKGDQSNCIVVDHHCDAYAVSDDENKRKLQRMADGV